MNTESGKTAFIYSAPAAWNEIQRSLKLTAFISLSEWNKKNIPNCLLLFLISNLVLCIYLLPCLSLLCELCAAALAMAHL